MVIKRRRRRLHLQSEVLSRRARRREDDPRGDVPELVGRVEGHDPQRGTDAVVAERVADHRARELAYLRGRLGVGFEEGVVEWELEG